VKYLKGRQSGESGRRDSGWAGEKCPSVWLSDFHTACRRIKEKPMKCDNCDKKLKEIDCWRLARPDKTRFSRLCEKCYFDEVEKGYQLAGDKEKGNQ